tara:strand:+ start:539 stop:865 length:327 start_codon:yes stop_codon:yes gene_type:complete
MTKTLYFSISNDPSDAADDALMINADLFIAAGFATATTSKLFFADRANTGAAETIITLTHDEGRGIDVLEDICEAMAGEPRDGFIVIADEAEGEFCSPFINACALTQL